MLTAEEMESFWRGYLRGPQDARDPLASPLLADLAGLPPAFLAIAECDILAEQSLAMAQQLEAAGVRVRSVVYAGAAHSFLEAVAISPLSAKALQEASQWLREVCA
jgi:acetyl esterase